MDLNVRCSKLEGPKHKLYRQAGARCSIQPKLPTCTMHIQGAFLPDVELARMTINLSLE